MKVQGQFGMQFQVKGNWHKSGYETVFITKQQLHTFKCRTECTYLKILMLPRQRSEIKHATKILHFTLVGPTTQKSPGHLPRPDYSLRYIKGKTNLF
jgi:hypothetical protein